jgi:Leucine-rich repeat (LRR) protein
MYDEKDLAWIDLSHNLLTEIDYDFKDFAKVRTLYLHCNYFNNLTELVKLQHLNNLKALTIHGNPIETIPNFRLYIIGILPQLIKLDSVLISKKERDNAIYMM